MDKDRMRSYKRRKLWIKIERGETWERECG